MSQGIKFSAQSMFSSRKKATSALASPEVSLKKASPFHLLVPPQFQMVHTIPSG